MLQAFATSKTQFAVNGRPEVKALFLRLGFEQKPNLAVFCKVVNPSHRRRASGEGFFRKWAGTAKNMASVWLTRTRPAAQTVELRMVPGFTDEIDCLQRRSSMRIVMCRHDHLWLNYLLRCPLSGFSGWTIHTSGRMIGFAVLKITPHERVQLGTIVDCWLDTEDPSYWQAAVAALNDRLRALSAYTVTAYATTPSLHAALLLNGFVKRREINVYLRDKQQLLPRGLLFGFSRFDADGVLH